MFLPSEVMNKLNKFSSIRTDGTSVNLEDVGKEIRETSILAQWISLGDTSEMH
jgi:hypothetical protein